MAGYDNGLTYDDQGHLPRFGSNTHPDRRQSNSSVKDDDPRDRRYEGKYDEPRRQEHHSQHQSRQYLHKSKQRINGILANIGDKHERYGRNLNPKAVLEKHVKDMEQFVCGDPDRPCLREAVVDKLVEVASFIPHKSSHLAAFMGYMVHHRTRLQEGEPEDPRHDVVKDETKQETTGDGHRSLRRLEFHAFGVEVVAKLHSELANTFEVAENPSIAFWRAVNLLRFAADLVNVGVVTLQSFITCLRSLAEMAVANRCDLADSASDACLLAVMLAVVVLDAEPAKHISSDLHDLAAVINEYAATRKSSDLDLFCSGQSASPANEDYFNQCRRLFHYMCTSKWRCRSVIKTHSLGSVADDIRPHRNSRIHALPAFELRWHLVRTTLSEVVFTETLKMSEKDMLDCDLGLWKSSFSTRRVTGSLLGLEYARNLYPDRYLFEEHEVWMLESLILSLLYCFHGNANITAKNLLLIQCQHDQFEIVLAETLVSELLRVPVCHLERVYIIQVILHVATLQGSTQAVFQTCIDRLILRCREIDDQSVDTLSVWISHWWATFSQESEPSPGGTDFEPRTSVIKSSPWFTPSEMKSDKKDEKAKQNACPGLEFAGCSYMESLMRNTIERFAALMTREVALRRLPTCFHHVLTCQWLPTSVYLPLELNELRALKDADAVVKDETDTECTRIDSYEADFLMRLLRLNVKPDSVERIRIINAARVFLQLLRTRGKLADRVSDQALESVFAIVNGRDDSFSVKRQKVELADEVEDPPVVKLDDDALLEKVAATAADRLTFGSPINEVEIFHIVMQALLVVTSRSLTHFRRGLDLYADLIEDYTLRQQMEIGPLQTGRQVRSALCTMVIMFWRFCPSRSFVWLRELLSRSLLFHSDVKETLLTVVRDDGFVLHGVEWPHSELQAMPQELPVHVAPNGYLFRCLLAYVLKRYRYGLIKAAVDLKTAARCQSGEIQEAQNEYNEKSQEFQAVMEELVGMFVERGIQGGPNEPLKVEDDAAAFVDNSSLTQQALVITRQHLPLLNRERLQRTLNLQTYTSTALSRLRRLLTCEVTMPLTVPTDA
ncbi:MAG: uncharacterized protein KVP18_001310 [Porospora cf. gigantea A]|uniref:uncharacterized protein n=1 Tax=Porospora cf. gigantea A TaxID=2853593 RepID=UPI003559A772|nr:MAG: hypothetical protein KVP18_001310 [Porospora cf. gigantea A]